jgi:hypothetical protein
MNINMSDKWVSIEYAAEYDEWVKSGKSAYTEGETK